MEYLIPVPEKIPEFYERIYERATKNSQLECISFRRKKGVETLYYPGTASYE